MGERDNHIAIGRRPQPRGGTTPASWREEATLMEIDPGALSRPGRVREQELLIPQSLLEMVAEIENSSGKSDWIFSFFCVQG